MLILQKSWFTIYIKILLNTEMDFLSCPTSVSHLERIPNEEIQELERINRISTIIFK